MTTDGRALGDDAARDATIEAVEAMQRLGATRAGRGEFVAVKSTVAPVPAVPANFDPHARTL